MKAFSLTLLGLVAAGVTVAAEPLTDVQFCVGVFFFLFFVTAAALTIAKEDAWVK